MYKLRPYQQEAVDKGLKFFADKKIKKNAIIVIPSGGGKSLVIAKLAMELDEPVLVFQPSKELLEQNYQKYVNYGGEASIYSASKNTKEIGHVTFATIGSAKSKPELFEHFKYVIIDECHLVSPNASSMYSKFFERLNVKILGLTATPIRLKAYSFPEPHSKLGILTRQRPRSFQDFLYVAQISTLYAGGYLVPCRYVDIDYDTSKLVVNSTGADYKEASITEQFKAQGLLEKIQYGYLKAYKRNHILIFVSSIAEAQEVANTLPSCAIVSSKTPKKERTKLIADFKSGKIRGMVNVGVLTCLSENTEILTKEDGWVDIKNIKMTHKVAQYSNNKITFDHPNSIINKKKNIGEKMVKVDGRYITIDVTPDHDLLATTSKTGNFKKIKSEKLIGKKCYIPVSGFSECEDMIVKQETIKQTKSRFIAINSYNYRKKGLSKQDAKNLAIEQWEIKNNLKYKNPNELTLDECRFIGFWIGDGNRTKTKDGSERFSLSQSKKSPLMLNWISCLLKNCNLHFTYKDYSTNTISSICGKSCNISDHRRYFLSIGTGGHKQKRDGIYKLLPYLHKDGTKLFWGLNRDQYFALMEGLWKADGWHGNNLEYNGSKITGCSKPLFDLLQAIGVCRGFRVTMKPVKKRKNNKLQLYSISLKNKRRHQLTNDRLKYYNLRKPTTVWCVNMPKGTIVTRNKGTVTIMGNCGFDYPEIDMIIIARPTLSLAMYYQMVGRGIRLFEGKEDCIVFDLVGNHGRFGSIEDLQIINGYGGWAIYSKDKQISGVPLTFEER